jgi:hypothetical protein
MQRRTLLQGSLLLPAGLAVATPGLPPRIAWQAPRELASGAGLRGPWQQNESRYDFVDDPTVAIAGDGTAIVAWVDQRRKAVLVQRRTARGEPDGPTVEIDRSPATFSWIPRLAVAPDDDRRVYALWQEIIFSGGSHGGEMLFARSIDAGRTFGPPVNLSASRGGDGKGRIRPDSWDNGSYDLLAASEGRVFTAWTEYDGMLWVSTSADAGRSFTRPRRVAGGGGSRPARAPSLALTAAGDLLLAWTEGDHAEADIQLARSTDGGRTFSPPLAVGPSPHRDDAPSLVVDAAGTVHLAYAESAGGPLQRQHILVARSRDAGRSFDVPRPLGLPERFSGAAYPSLATDARGGVYLLCELQHDPRLRPRALGLALSVDGGASFGPVALVPASSDPGGGFNGSSQGLLMRKLAVSASGDVAVVNSALLQDSHSRVWMVRGRRQD